MEDMASMQGCSDFIICTDLGTKVSCLSPQTEGPWSELPVPMIVYFSQVGNGFSVAAPGQPQVEQPHCRPELAERTAKPMSESQCLDTSQETW